MKLFIYFIAFTLGGAVFFKFSKTARLDDFWMCTFILFVFVCTVVSGEYLGKFIEWILL